MVSFLSAKNKHIQFVWQWKVDDVEVLKQIIVDPDITIVQSTP